MRRDYRLLIKGNAGGEALGNPLQRILTLILAREDPPTGLNIYNCVTTPTLEGISLQPD